MPDDIEIERMAPRGEVAQVLHALADGVEVGSVTVGEGDETMEVAVPDELEYELELEVGVADGEDADDEEEAADGKDDMDEDDMDEDDMVGDVTVELEVELEWTAGEGHAVEASSIDRQAPTGDAETETERAQSPIEPSPGGDAVEPAPSATAAETTSTPVRAPGVPDSAARFELFTDRAGEWRWRLVHRNGNVIADSGEGYARKIDARNGLESVRTNAAAADVVELQPED